MRRFKFQGSFPRKILLTLLVLFVISLFVWTVTEYSLMRNTLMQQKIIDLDQMLLTSSDYLGLYGQNISRSTLSLAGVIGILDTEESIKSVLVSFRDEFSSQYQNVVYVKAPDEIYSNKTHLLEIINTDIYYEFYRKATGSTYRGVYISEPYTSPISLEKTVAAYAPTSDGKHVVICEVDVSQMTNSIITNDSGYFWVISSGSGNIVSSSDLNNIDSRTMSGFESVLRSKLGTKRSVEINGKKYIVKNMAHVFFDWSLTVFIAESAITEAIYPVILKFSVIGVIVIAVMAVLSLVLGSYISRPIVTLSDKIRNAENLSQVDLSAEMKRSDEIGILATSLSEMNDKINNLIAQQEQMADERRRLEIDVLQGQIHPHFLGNTLTCIASLVKDGQREKGYRAIVMLTKLMHYSISQTTAITTLADELEATRSYLELRLMRSPGLFSYNIYVPPAHMECMIPKLILQPIVENAITHGFVEQGRTYQLSIVSYVKDGHLYIAVNNDGAEIPSSRVDEIRSGNITPSPKSHGIGLTNVFERLRLNSNMSVGGFVESSAGNGTTTTLDLGGLSMSDSISVIKGRMSYKEECK